MCGSKVWGSQEIVEKLNNWGEIDMHDFPVHDCTQEQKGSRSLDKANGRLPQDPEFCYHSNVKSHVSCLLVVKF